MELALHLAEPQDLDRLGGLDALEPSEALRGVVGQAWSELKAAFPGQAFERVAWGTEFCEHLVSSPGPLRAMAAAVRARGLAFTLLTPYCGGTGLRRIAAQLEVLSDYGPAEVVFNDWGVLNLLRREFPGLTPVQGRLLHKSLRDPRVMGQYAQAEPATGVTPTLDALRNSSFQNPSYGMLVQRFGVRRVELDALPQGTSFAVPGLTASLYFPFAFISTARVCQVAGLGHRKAEKFQPSAPCRHECQTHLLTYTYTNSPFANRDQQFLLKGNTYFFAHTAAMRTEVLEQAEAGGVSRLIFQPRLPMLAAEPAAPRKRLSAPLVQLEPA